MLLNIFLIAILIYLLPDILRIFLMIGLTGIYLLSEFKDYIQKDW